MNEEAKKLKIVKEKKELPAVCLCTPNPNDPNFEEKFSKDIYNLVKESNIHRHNTCYKYAKITDKRPNCRMRFPRALVKESSIDVETGELRLKRSDEWVNNFNPTIMSACRCNMDIKYIFNGKDAKAICYYITDYVTKSNLSFYDIYSLVLKGVKSFEEYSDEKKCGKIFKNFLDIHNIILFKMTDDSESIMERSRRMILRCYNTIATKSELSGVQVASYLMNWGDNYTNQNFVNIFLIGIERYLQSNLDHTREHLQCDESMLYYN